ncbi:MAG: hypothetical protein Ct9H90mP27_3260 [Gammaproteobacteria bacterium]|nr:MAG: hypothetical protein Ct9H90mP27_3260 [Gammaproteobacteria bacterium]
MASKAIPTIYAHAFEDQQRSTLIFLKDVRWFWATLENSFSGSLGNFLFLFLPGCGRTCFNKGSSYWLVIFPAKILVTNVGKSFSLTLSVKAGLESPVTLLNAEKHLSCAFSTLEISMVTIRRYDQLFSRFIYYGVIFYQ